MTEDARSYLLRRQREEKAAAAAATHAAAVRIHASMAIEYARRLEAMPPPAAEARPG